MRAASKLGFHIIECNQASEFSKFVFPLMVPFGWNPIYNYLEETYAANPSGWFLGINRNDETGSYDPINSMVGLKFDEEYGSCGLYICKETFRGKSLSLPVYLAGFGHIKGCRTLGGDAVVEAMPMYEKLGKKAIGPTYRKSFKVSPQILDKLKVKDPKIKTRTIGKDDIENLVRYDKTVTGVNRDRFLASWILPSQTTNSTIAYNAQGSIVGFGALKKAVTGYRLGPLFADDISQAPIILKALLKDLPKDETVIFDINGLNNEAVKLFDELGAKDIVQFLWNFTNGFPKGLDKNKIFVRTSVEFGL